VTAEHGPDDLLCLVADRNAEAALQGVLSRCESLQIRALTSTIRTHPERDPGCYLRGHEFLRFHGKGFLHALVMFDREGCGNEAQSREELEREVEDRLQSDGWGDRARAVVIDPELEAWVWSDSPQVEEALGWVGRARTLRSWLIERGLLAEAATKPLRPKEAVEEALRLVRKPRSSAIYRELAEGVSLWRCRDRAFAKLRLTLQGWFGRENSHEHKDLP